MVDVANLAIRADSSQIQTANKRMEKMKPVASGAQKAVRALGGALAGMSAIQGARFIRNSIRSTAQISEMADVAQISSERIQELTKSFSDMAGVSESISQGGLRRFARRLDLARQGTGAASDTLERMNISLNQGTEPALNEVIAKLQEMSETQSITGAASQLFGEDAGPKMAAALAQGEDALRRQIKQLREHGRILNDETVEGARKANDEMEALADTLSTQFAADIAENADAIADVADALAQLTEWGIKGLAALTDLGEWLGENTAKLIHGPIDETTASLEEARQELEIMQSLPPRAGVTAAEIEKQRQLVEQLEREKRLKEQRSEQGGGGDQAGGADTGGNDTATQAAQATFKFRTLQQEYAAFNEVLDRRMGEIVAQNMSDIRDEVNPTRVELRRFREQMENMEQAIGRGDLGAEEAERLAGALQEGLSSDARSGVRQLADEFSFLSVEIGGAEDKMASAAETLRTVGQMQGANFQQTAAQIGKSFEDVNGAQAAGLQAVGAAFDNLTSIMKAGSKEQFETYKDMAQAQAAISAAMSILTVLDDPAIPTYAKIPLTATIGGLAAVQVAQIEQQEFQGGRAMGGQVQAGKSYMVGEQGPEIVTMGSSGMVTPNHKLGGGDNNVTQVFQVSGATSRDMQQQIRRAGPWIKQLAKQAVIEASGSGGRMTRAVGRRR